MKMTKKGAQLIRACLATESGLDNIKHYKARNIPAAGSFLRTEDTQISLF